VRSAWRDERGSTVAEFAVAIPAVLLVLAVALGGVRLAGVQLRAQDAAADAARGLARGDSAAVVRGRLDRQLPGASLQRADDGELVCATVRASADGPSAVLGLVPSARSCALGGGR